MSEKCWSERRKNEWGWEVGGGRRACETFLTDLLFPTFVTSFDNWISDAEMSICQFTEIALEFFHARSLLKPGS